MQMGRYSHSTRKTKEEKDADADLLVNNLILFLQDFFKISPGKIILSLIVMVMVIVGHVWFGCK